MLHPTLLWNPWDLRMQPFSNVVYAGLVCVEVLNGAGGLLGLVVMWELCRAVAVHGAERLGRRELQIKSSSSLLASF